MLAESLGPPKKKSTSDCCKNAAPQEINLNIQGVYRILDNFWIYLNHLVDSPYLSDLFDVMPRQKRKFLSWIAPEMD